MSAKKTVRYIRELQHLVNLLEDKFVKDATKCPHRVRAPFYSEPRCSYHEPYDEGPCEADYCPLPDFEE